VTEFQKPSTAGAHTCWRKKLHACLGGSEVSGSGIKRNFWLQSMCACAK